jgi:hypothetical protein
MIKEQSRHIISLECSVETPTHLACHILYNIFPQKGLNVLGHKLSSDHEALVTIDGALCTELGHHELKHVVGTTLHHLANLLEVSPQGLLGSLCSAK